jgi:hypothetical protein
MILTLKELNELYYALIIADKSGNFTDHKINRDLRIKLQEEINNHNLNEVN